MLHVSSPFGQCALARKGGPGRPSPPQGSREVWGGARRPMMTAIRFFPFCQTLVNSNSSPHILNCFMGFQAILKVLFELVRFCYVDWHRTHANRLLESRIMAIFGVSRTEQQLVLLITICCWNEIFNFTSTPLPLRIHVKHQDLILRFDKTLQKLCIWIVGYWLLAKS